MRYAPKSRLCSGVQSSQDSGVTTPATAHKEPLEQPKEILGFPRNEREDIVSTNEHDDFVRLASYDCRNSLKSVICKIATNPEVANHVASFG